MQEIQNLSEIINYYLVCSSAVLGKLKRNPVYIIMNKKRVFASLVFSISKIERRIKINGDDR